MKTRVVPLELMGEVAHRHEADSRVGRPGTAVVVRRGVVRSLVIACPDGCGETLTINLDNRAGAAWRLYRDRHGSSLFPSVWRDTGCKSHFIVWRSRIYLLGEDDDGLFEDDDSLEEQLLRLLGSRFVSYVVIADEMGEVPWTVLVACRRLVARNQATEGAGPDRGKFKLR